MPRGSTKKTPPAKAGTKRRLEFEDAAVADARRKKAAVADDADSTTNAKSSTPSLEKFMSPVSTKTKRSVVTPEEEEKKQEDIDEAELFVPKYIHKNLGYHRQGKSKLDPKKQSAFEQIVETYVIPKDLEQSRAHGPLSGTCFEERVLQAYALGNLAVRQDFEGETRICTACAEKGHKRNECPTLI